MTVRVRVRTSRSGIQQMLAAPFMVREMDRRVQRAKRYGRFSSPFRTGKYSRNWYSFAGVRNGVAYGQAGNKVEYAWFVERDTRNADGSIRTRGQRVVEKTLPVLADNV